MNKTRWIGLGIGILLIAAAFGVVAWQTVTMTGGQNLALAQAPATPTPGPVNPSTPPKSGPTTTDIGNTFWTQLAAKLGVSLDTLKADAIQVRKDMLDQAVKDGRITQAQADQLKQKLDANGLIAPIFIGPGGGRFGPGLRGPKSGQPLAPGTTPRGVGPRGFGFRFGFGSAELEAAAKSLNLSAADLVTQLRGGKTLADVAKAQNVDQAVVKQAIIDARKAQIERELTDGLITQAQATALEANLTPDKIDLTRPFLR